MTPPENSLLQNATIRSYFVARAAAFLAIRLPAFASRKRVLRSIITAAATGGGALITLSTIRGSIRHGSLFVQKTRVFTSLRRTRSKQASNCQRASARSILPISTPTSCGDGGLAHLFPRSEDFDDSTAGLAYLIPFFYIDFDYGESSGRHRLDFAGKISDKTFHSGVVAHDHRRCN